MTTQVHTVIIHIAFLTLLIAWLIFDVPYLDWVVGILYALRVIAAAILWCVSAIPEVTFARAQLPQNVYLGLLSMELLVLALGWQAGLIILEVALAAPVVNFYYATDEADRS